MIIYSSLIISPTDKIVKVYQGKRQQKDYVDQKANLEISSGKLVCSLDAVIWSLNISIYPEIAFYVHYMREGISKAISRRGRRPVSERRINTIPNQKLHSDFTTRTYDTTFMCWTDIPILHTCFNSFFLLLATERFGRPSEPPRITLVNSGSVGRWLRLRLRISSFRS